MIVSKYRITVFLPGEEITEYLLICGDRAYSKNTRREEILGKLREINRRYPGLYADPNEIEQAIEGRTHAISVYTEEALHPSDKKHGFKPLHEILGDMTHET